MLNELFCLLSCMPPGCGSSPELHAWQMRIVFNPCRFNDFALVVYSKRHVYPSYYIMLVIISLYDNFVLLNNNMVVYTIFYGFLPYLLQKSKILALHVRNSICVSHYHHIHY